MNPTELLLTDEELFDIIAHFKERELKPEDYGDENTIHIDHYMIKYIEPLFNIEPLPKYESGENEYTTVLKLDIWSCMLLDEKCDPIEISEEAKEAIVKTMQNKFYVLDEIEKL